MATTTVKAAAAKADESIHDAGETVRKTTNESAAQVRDFAEKSVQQARDNFGRLKTAAEETSDAFEDSYASATKGYKEFTSKSVEATRANVNAHFDFLSALIGAKSVSQAVELQSSYARKQFETLTAQAKELSALAQKATTDGAKPLQEIAARSYKGVQPK